MKYAGGAVAALLIGIGIALATAAFLMFTEVPVSAPSEDGFDVSVGTLDANSIPPPDDEAQPDHELATPAPIVVFIATPTRAATPGGTPRAAATPTRAPTPTPARATPTPGPTLPPVPATLNIVLLGSDRRPGSDDWRTDTMIVVMVEPKAKRVGVVNVARDILVAVPGRSPNRVNTLDEFGGPPLVKQVVGSLLGIKIDYFVRIDFEGMVKAIDAVGPIAVQVDCALEEQYPDASKPGGVRTLKVAPGRVSMTGQMALDYSRSRLSTGIFDRMRRQNRVLLGVREKLLSPSMFSRIPQLWETTGKYVQTDLPGTLILPLARLAADTKLSDVHGLTIDGTLAPSVTSAQGWWVMMPNIPMIRTAVRDVFNAPALSGQLTRPGGCQ